MKNDPERVLIAEDEEKIAEILSDYLRRHGYRVDRVGRGDAVLPWVDAHGADLVLLDLMLPGMNGLDACRLLRERHPGTAIVMVTARVEEIDRLLGLELGADDYICKPFSPREVVARVKAVLRRAHGPSAGAEPPGLVLDPAGWRAFLGGRDLGLTAVEFQLLQVLAGQPGRIFTRDQLIEAMYRDDRVVADRTVDSHVKKLRRKIADVDPAREVIRSLYGAGYKFEP